VIRTLSRDRAAVAVAAAAVVGVALLLVVLAPRWRDDGGGTAPARTVTVRGHVEPATSLFGDLVTLRADVLVDRDQVDPGRVRVDARFTPFRLVSQTRRVREVGANASRIEYQFDIQCVSLACLRAGVRRDDSGAVQSTPIVLRPGKVVAEPRTGAPLTAALVWPKIVVQSRLTPSELDRGDPGVGELPVPRRTYAVDPDLAGGLLLLAGGLLVLLGAYLLARVVLGRRVVPRLRLPAHLTPLDRAVALVRDASANGEVAGERKALERLAGELRRQQDGGLAEAAGRLAWSARRPSAAEIDELIVSVDQTRREH
jgi:hypothetical protein